MDILEASRTRNLMRSCQRASLAVSMTNENDTTLPYVALVLVAFDFGANPILFISDLAEHSKAIQKNPQASLLLDATIGRRNPLAHPRYSLVGEIEYPDAKEAAQLLSRFVNRHAEA
ncbi:MAG: pyridoxamine 5'-phosphate oxidase family protein, partial [Alphaproteobacteria bacterium]|nr:pyridoxamine 5'-phosphate oxidase family protein [Alphaproteobacteria bacterium]